MEIEIWLPGEKPASLKVLSRVRLFVSFGFFLL